MRVVLHQQDVTLAGRFVVAGKGGGLVAGEAPDGDMVAPAHLLHHADEAEQRLRHVDFGERRAFVVPEAVAGICRGMTLELAEPTWRYVCASNERTDAALIVDDVAVARLEGCWRAQEAGNAETDGQPPHSLSRIGATRYAKAFLPRRCDATEAWQHPAPSGPWRIPRRAQSGGSSKRTTTASGRRSPRAGGASLSG
ncbi:phage P2 GpU [Babesia caballi]|uniref:Phage P2 GpU n=1 Tax=Babesia caballi TaxID=5871 RepID=A0AAV4LUW8_BABCB|nr:phage P2 GpU [Babesia caballi]